MAYLLYKYIRDKRRQRAAADNAANIDSNLPAERNEAPVFSGRNDLPDTSTALTSLVDTNARNEHISSKHSKSTEDAHDSKAEQRAMRNYRLRLVAGLFFPYLVQSLNTTMIASALPFIASDFSRTPLPRQNRRYQLATGADFS